MVRNSFGRALVAAAVVGSAVASTFAHAAWEPTKPVEFIVPAGTGGGADQMARFIQGVVAKNNLMKQPLVVVNKSGGAGAEGFLEVKGAKGDANKIIITLSNLFTTPLATGVPFNWKDLTPVAMLAQDEFVLWVNAESPYKTAGDYIAAIKGGDAGKFKMAGTGSKQEDQIITVALEKVVGKKMTYIPFKGGGDVAVQLVGKHVDSTVNNPIEAVAHWRAGALRPLCVFDSQPMAYPDEGDHHAVVAGHPAVQDAGPRRRVPDAARNLHAAGRHAGAGRLLRGPFQEGARDRRLEEIQRGRRLQGHVHDGQGVRGLGDAGRQHAQAAHAGSRVHRQVGMIGAAEAKPREARSARRPAIAAADAPSDGVRNE
jgi:tripartite-type tricarboxylate transporter receptor subunit TctC